MNIADLKKIILVTKAALEIVLCRHAGALMAASLGMMTLPLAHAVGHNAWAGISLSAAHPALVDLLQILLGYLFAVIVSGNTFLAYWILRPLWNMITFACQAWQAVLQSTRAIRYVDPEAAHVDTR